YVTAAVADSARPAADTERDATRKPAETLAFAGVKPGDQVVELAPGKGYYTRLLSAVVGPNGKVYTLSSPPKPDAPPPPVQAIAADRHARGSQASGGQRPRMDYAELSRLPQHPRPAGVDPQQGGVRCAQAR